MVAIPPDLKAWVDAQASEIGVNAVIFIRMLVFKARRDNANVGLPSHGPVAAPRVGAAVVVRAPLQVSAPSPDAQAPDPDAWRGAVEDDDDVQAQPAQQGAPAQQPQPAAEDGPPVDIDALVAARVAEALDAQRDYAPPEPTEMLSRRPSAVGHPATMALRQPASRYTMPAHIAGGFA